MEDTELRKLVQKNTEMTQEVLSVVKSIKKYIIWQRVFGILKLLIILVPIVLGIIYLPPLLKGAIDQYKEIIDITVDPVNNINLDSIKTLIDL